MFATKTAALHSKFAQLTSSEIKMFQDRALVQACLGWPMHALNTAAQAQVRAHAAVLAERMCVEHAMARSMMMGR